MVEVKPTEAPVVEDSAKYEAELHKEMEHSYEYLDICKESIIPMISYLVISVYFPLFMSFLQYYNCVMT